MSGGASEDMRKRAVGRPVEEGLLTGNRSPMFPGSLSGPVVSSIHHRFSPVVQLPVTQSFADSTAFSRLVLPDLWQQAALRALRAGKDVVVDAPTGAGKT